MRELSGWTVLGENIIVKEAPPITSIRGIALPENAGRTDPIGTVVAVGPDSIKSFPVGSGVMFTPSGGFPTYIGDDEYIVLRPVHIVATCEAIHGVADYPSQSR